MKFKSNFNLDIEPKEWLYLAAFTVIIILLIHGDIGTAIKVLTEWFRSL